MRLRNESEKGLTESDITLSQLQLCVGMCVVDTPLVVVLAFCLVCSPALQHVERLSA